MGLVAYQLQKRSSYNYANIQDKFSANPECSIFALADGTTQSFNSDKWAELLTVEFVKKPTFISEDLISLFTKCAKEFRGREFNFSNNPAKASLEKAKQMKGGTSTFLGVEVTSANQIHVIACGDTSLFHLKKDNIVISFPFESIDELDSNNRFLNSEQLLEVNDDDSYFNNATIKYDSGDIIVIATDALSRLFLKNNSIIKEFIVIKSFNELLDFCVKYWDNKELEEDDISALVFDNTNPQKLNTIIPPEGFSFPKEPEYEFKPTIIPRSNVQNNVSINTFTDMQIKEIIDQFSGVANDFRQVKKKQNSIFIVLLFAVALLFINLFGLLFLSPNKTNRNSEGNFKRTDSVVLQQKNIKALQIKIDSLTNALDSLANPSDSVKK